MWPTIKKFFTDETAFQRMSRAFLGVFAVGGAGYANDIAALLTPGHAELATAIKAVAMTLAFVALGIGAGDKTPENVKLLANEIQPPPYNGAAK